MSHSSPSSFAVGRAPANKLNPASIFFFGPWSLDLGHFSTHLLHSNFEIRPSKFARCQRTPTPSRRASGSGFYPSTARFLSTFYLICFSFLAHHCGTKPLRLSLMVCKLCKVCEKTETIEETVDKRLKSQKIARRHTHQKR